MELKINNLSKKYIDKFAVSNVNFTLNQGIYGLLGANGAGKTTLIKMLVTLLEPTNGSITYESKNILLDQENYKKVLGYLPQDFGYYPEFTPLEYLKHLSLLKGLKDKELKSRCFKLLKKVGLYEERNKKMKKLSGGMIRRVGVAQALLNQPEVLILDEPTAGLDPKERIRFRTLINEISKERIILLSTHIVSDLEIIAHKILLMKDGYIFKQGTIEQCLDDLKGKVWEVKHKYDNTKIRIISEEKPDPEAFLVEAILEDLFVSEKESWE